MIFRFDPFHFATGLVLSAAVWAFLYPPPGENQAEETSVLELLLGGPQKFQGHDAQPACRRFWWLSYFSVTAYLLSIPEGKKAMRRREPVQLPPDALLAWNTALSVRAGLREDLLISF